jgi:hypothetical protein
MLYGWFHSDAKGNRSGLHPSMLDEGAWAGSRTPEKITTILEAPPRIELGCTDLQSQGLIADQKRPKTTLSDIALVSS